MKYPENFALHLQSNLREIANDILSCAYFISGDLVGLETAGDRRWQYGSDLICRCIRSGLVKVWNFQTMCHDHDSFLLAIASVSPFGPDGGELWNATFLDQTEVLRTLLETFFPTDKPYDPKLNPEFVSELESLFEQHGVGWSSEAILQIRQPRRMQ